MADPNRTSPSPLTTGDSSHSRGRGDVGASRGQRGGGDLFTMLRRLDAEHRELPRLGTAAGPHDEPARIGAAAALDFAAEKLDALERRDTPTVISREFGLLGPNGPLPLSVTEDVRSSLLHDRDAAPLHFIEMLQQRLATLFFRAYADARPTIAADRPDEDSFALYLGTLFGRHPGITNRDRHADGSRSYFAGRHAAATRSAEALEAIISHEFRQSARITPFALDWLKLDDGCQTVLGAGSETSQLGGGAVLGRRVRDRQSHIDLRLGPVPPREFADLLPGGKQSGPLADLVRSFTRGELSCRVHVLLERDSVPQTTLGTHGALGHSSWIGTPADAVVEDAVFALR